ncbi:3-succinoylsemialdehyde-pyridine dehydrogenase [Flavobacterium bizetiae]|uniref:aldehyde dehydrogenase (NAD(+)) n=1 Tax=Flavobacterium bizetiae TaxID=2704140 RepID=A0A6J4G9J4_9FLAO|nr:aldehyde dehydrogenase family protein [Flavobacterium bizetiae]CAA9194975.1 3-succinoylsemialdehyde-pyridine dehydrogenase [Flavobacterium bizetiae]CAD5340887.1 3-succinoylsemialdehyde-pyridine dehydrogenase [Flavobacterium bizetiae]CAD5346169.1 3-succinoylsemialdehyde-pyridine dehydrogenase [Flavobacterium bizetiae]
MKTIDKIYVNGEFITPQGTEYFDLISPTTNEKLGKVLLGNQKDTQNAIAAAKEAFKTFSKTTTAERIQYLKNIQASIEKRKEEFIDVMIEEYGGTRQFVTISYDYMLKGFESAINLLNTYNFTKTMGESEVQMTPLGVVGIIIPWNSSNGFICSKLSTAIVAGCTTVIKPSEMSAQQTQLIAECLHEAGLPKGVFNIVNGLGEIVGAEISRNPDIAKISFTGSTNVGKIIAKEAVETMKRVTLELGGKSPNIILDDANFSEAIPLAIIAAYMNSGQACIAGTRLLVPENRLEEVKELIKEVISNTIVGDPKNETTAVGPMVSAKQYERVQSYIQTGINEGAEILTGGLGKPEGLEKGNFVKPTVFVNANNQMRIAREEIFGPVLSVITYKTEEEAVEIANDTTYGLQAYVSSSDEKRAHKIASQINAGRVQINGMGHDPMAPFGGFKQSGIGREFGIMGLEAYLEPKALIR